MVLVAEIALRSTCSRVPSRCPWLLWLGVFVLAAGPDWGSVLVAQADGEPIAVIDSVRGSWVRTQDPDGRNLGRGDLLRRTDTVRLAGTTDGLLKVYRLETGTLWEKSCTPEDPCRGSFRPVSADEPVGFWSFLSKYWTSDRRLSPVFVRGRSVGNEGPQHALVVVGSEEADLSDAVRNVPPGSYRARLAPVPDAGAPNADAEYNFTLLVTKEKSVAGHVRPGLYAFTLENERGETLGATVVFLATARRDVQASWQTTLERLNRANLASETRSALHARVLYAIHASSNER